MPSPIHQIFLAIQMAVATNPVTAWFNGVPYPGTKSSAAPTGGVKYWADGVPVQTIYR